MTITTNDTRDEYTATAGQTTFNYTFKIFADTDLLVYQTASGATPDDATDLITAYTVTGVGNANGGTIVLDTGATLNDKITIVSNISYERDTDYQFNGDYTADVVNDEQDKQLSLIKQVKAALERIPQFQKSVQGAENTTLPEPETGSFVRWDANGNLENVSLNTLATGDNAAAITASTSSLPAHPSGATYDWSFADVQGFINQLVNGVGTGLNERGVVFKYLPRAYAGAGHPSYLLQGSIRIGDASDSDGYISLSQSVSGIYLYRYKANALRAEIVCEETNGFMVAIPGSTSGYGYVLECKKDQGYISLISATGVQTKVAEWGSNACFKPSKALQLPSYANLAAINAAIASPAHGMMVMTASQGAAIYKTSSWVRVVDETTAIT